MEYVTVKPMTITKLIEAALVNGEVGLIELFGRNDFLVGINNSNVDRIGQQRRGSIIGLNLEAEI